MSLTRRNVMYFEYDGTNSSVFGVSNVLVGGGMYEEPLLSSVNINEIETRGGKRYFLEVEKDPIEFSLQLGFLDGFSEQKLREVAKWLSSEYYKPLIFSDAPYRVYYCMPTGEVQITHTGEGQGYLDITFRCDSEYVYGRVYTTETFQCNGNMEVKVVNKGDVDVFPVTMIKKHGDGDIIIKNIHDYGSAIEFVNLQDQDIIYIDHKDEDIFCIKKDTKMKSFYYQGEELEEKTQEEDYIDIWLNSFVKNDKIKEEYRYDNHNGVFLRLLKGANLLELTGNFDLQTIYQPVFVA